MILVGTVDAAVHKCVPIGSIAFGMCGNFSLQSAGIINAECQGINYGPTFPVKFEIAFAPGSQYLYFPTETYNNTYVFRAGSLIMQDDIRYDTWHNFTIWFRVISPVVSKWVSFEEYFGLREYYQISSPDVALAWLEETTQTVPDFYGAFFEGL